MELDIEVEAGWPLPDCAGATDWQALAERAAAAVATLAPELTNPRLSARLLFADDATVHALNLEWRGKDKPTNVLSFPMLERDDLLALDADGPPELLGDIALALETCAREAAEKGVSLADHTSHLVIHGLLHLAGHDHETSPADAQAMESLEIQALALISVGNPYEDGPYVAPDTNLQGQ